MSDNAAKSLSQTGPIHYPNTGKHYQQTRELIIARETSHKQQGSPESPTVTRFTYVMSILHCEKTGVLYLTVFAVSCNTLILQSFHFAWGR